MTEETTRIEASSGTVIGDNAHVVQHFRAPTETIVWPVRVGRPPLIADAFVDRPSLRASIAEAMSDGGITVPTRGASVLAGDGGTGKTQLALRVWMGVTGQELLGSSRAKTDLAVTKTHRAELAVWVTATSRSAIQTTYAEAAKRLHLCSDGSDPDMAAEKLLDWLSTATRSWFVVLDDVKDPKDLTHLWPIGANGSVLVTTRSRDAAFFGHTRRRIDVDVFTPQESLNYLEQKLKDRPGLPPNALSEAENLGCDLGFLPLALAQAASVVANDAITCGEYRRMLSDRRASLHSLLPADVGDEHPRSTAATWSLAIESADRIEPLGLASKMAILISILDPNGIPEMVLTSQPAISYLIRKEGIERLHNQQVDARRALRNLDRFSVISHDPLHSTRAVRMHALAQRATREHAEDDSLDHAISAATAALIAVWPEVESDQSLSQALRNSAISLTAVAGAKLWVPAASELLFIIGKSLGESGRAGEAAEHFKNLLNTGSSRFEPSDPQLLRIRYRMGYWTGQAGDAVAAAQHFDDLLVDCIRVHGTSHPDTLATRANLILWLWEAGDANNARRELQDLIVDRVNVLEPQMADASARLLDPRLVQDDPASAAALLDQLLNRQRVSLSESHPYMTIVQAVVARLRGEAGDSEGAAVAFERLGDKVPVLRRYHPFILLMRADAAYWRRRSGDATGAKAALEELLADRTSVLGPEHPDTLRTRLELARSCKLNGDMPSARVLLLDLLKDGTKLLKENERNRHVISRCLDRARKELASSRENDEREADRSAEGGDTEPYRQLAGLWEYEGFRTGAERVAEKAAALGDTEPWLQLAWARAHNRDPEGAERAADQAALHADTRPWREIAAAYEESGDQLGAEYAAERAEAAGDARSWHELGQIRERIGDQIGAERSYRRAESAGDTRACLDVGRLCEQMNDHAGAIDAYKRGARLNYVYAWRKLARLFEEIGDSASADHAADQAAAAGDQGARIELLDIRETTGGAALDLRRGDRGPYHSSDTL